MPKSDPEMMFKSRVPNLIGEVLAEQGGEIPKQKDIAEATNINRMTLSGWMKGSTFTSLDSDVAFRLCEYFNVSIGDLVEFVPNPKRRKS